MIHTDVCQLDVRFCIVHFSDFLTCIPYFYQREGHLKIYLSLFYGAWTEENLQELKGIANQRDVGFELVCGND
ncbi:hypothetical protein BT69DRAFT_1278292, partial [Atractiella rhizophila]